MKKINIIISLLIITLILVSCNSNSDSNFNEKNINTNKLADDKVIDDRTSEEDIVDQILINNDGSNTTLEELRVKEVKSDGSKMLDYRFSEYGFPTKDGFKRGPDHYFGEDEDVYHIMYIKRSLDNPEVGTEFDFYIDKDTYLIRYQNGFISDMRYTTILENYSVDNEYHDEFFSIEDFQ